MMRAHRVLLAAAVVAAAGSAASAHQFNVFASVDCDAITVEATLENGRAPAVGEVRLRNADDEIVMTVDMGDTGTKRIPLGELDTSGGLKVEVQAGDHNDYWLLTPDDIARACTS